MYNNRYKPAVNEHLGVVLHRVSKDPAKHKDQNIVHSYVFDGFGWMVGVGVVMARVLAVWVSTAPPAQIDLV